LQPYRRNATKSLPRVRAFDIDVAGPETERQVANLLWSGRASPVSIRGKKEPVEYFCETFAAYRFEDSLADKDPPGYDMVEAILRMVWKK